MDYTDRRFDGARMEYRYRRVVCQTKPFPVYLRSSAGPRSVPVRARGSQVHQNVHSATKFDSGIMVARTTVAVILACSIANVFTAIIRPVSLQPAQNSKHCYCNLPSCITSNYICKSVNDKNQGCYKRYDIITNRFYYGCLDSFISEDVCQSKQYIQDGLPKNSIDDYQCCFTDFCNNDNVYNVFSTNRSKEQQFVNDMALITSPGSRYSDYYSNPEVWFRAIVIAFPICGILILLILICMAIHILRSEEVERPPPTVKATKPKNDGQIESAARELLPQPPSPVPEPVVATRLLPEYALLQKKLLAIFSRQTPPQLNPYNLPSLDEKVNPESPLFRMPRVKKIFPMCKYPFASDKFTNANNYELQSLTV